MKMNKKVIAGFVVGAVLLTGTTALAAGNGGRFMQEYGTLHTAAVCDTAVSYTHLRQFQKII